MKKGYAILLDSIVSLTFALIILVSMMGATFTQSDTSELSMKRLHYVSEDVLDVLNKKGVLDAVGEEWAAAAGNRSSPHFQNATNISTAYIERLLPPNAGYQLTIDDDIVAYNGRIPANATSANNSRPSIGSSTSMTHSTRLLVGYGRGLPTRGSEWSASSTWTTRWKAGN
jgi:hypothetical protein